MMQNIQHILQDVFGYSDFRLQQQEIIESLISGQDCLVIMPTGGGKSLCYQIPAIAMEGTALVVSPLIALMDDQVNALKQLNVKAEALHSNLSSSETNTILNRLESGDLDMIYISPERLMLEQYLDFLTKCKINLIAIDEAHCVSVWGNDFRPEYIQLGSLKDKFKDVPTIALTATADTATQQDMVVQLRLDDPAQFLSSFERANITTTVRPGQKRIEAIYKFLAERERDCGIVYCLSKKSTEDVASKLASRGYQAMAYHADLGAEERRTIQRRFQDDEVKIVCATIAFGMGIDKPNIRWVIHYNMPKNLESYYQEIGRAGRDGLPSEALLFYSWGDMILLKRFIDESHAEPQFKTVQNNKLERMWQYATGASCRTNAVLSYFGEYDKPACDHCDNCLHPPVKMDGSIQAQMALSAIARTNQSVGTNLLIDILRGSYRQELIHEGYDRIKTYGVGRNFSFAAWQHYITQFINQGIINLDIADHSKLKLTPQSHAVLKGERTIEITEFERKTTAAKVKKEKIDVNALDIDQELFEKLRNWRREIALEQNVPAYIIMNDRTLKHISITTPRTKTALLAVDGIGKAKLERFGDELLTIVGEYLAKPLS